MAILVQFRLGVSAKECFETLSQALLDQAPSKATTYEWYARFRSGHLDLEDSPREGRPKSAVVDINVDRVLKLVNEDRRMTMREIEKALDLSHGTVNRILHEELSMRKLCARWIPHQLKDHQKEARVAFCLSTLSQFNQGNSELVGNIITGDETWVYFYDPETKVQSKQWVMDFEDVPVKFMRARSIGKVMVAVFFRRNGILTPIVLDEGATVTGAWYSEVCLPRVLESLKEQRPQAQERNMFLHHDNAPAHRANVTRNFLASTKLTLLPHPPYSPDLAPCDFFLFPKIKRNLKGRQFGSREDLLLALQVELDKVTPEELQSCFQHWFQRMEKCIEAGGRYFEKC